MRSAIAKGLDNPGARPGRFSITCGSLPRLAAELQRLGQAADLPQDVDGCESLIAQHDDDPSRACYGHFVLAARVAVRRVHPLWVVK